MLKLKAYLHSRFLPFNFILFLSFPPSPSLSTLLFIPSHAERMECQVRGAKIAVRWHTDPRCDAAIIYILCLCYHFNHFLYSFCFSGQGETPDRIKHQGNNFYLECSAKSNLELEFCWALKWLVLHPDHLRYCSKSIICHCTACWEAPANQLDFFPWSLCCSGTFVHLESLT